MYFRVKLAVRALCATCVFLPAIARADGLDPPSLKFTSTTGARYLSNPNLTSVAPLDASAAVQTLQANYTHQLSKAWAFSLGGIGGIDRENRKGFSSDYSSADAGLSYKENSWTYTLGVSANWVFAPPFQPLAFRYQDITFSATSDEFKLGTFGTIVFQYGVRERFHELVGSSFVSPELRSTINRSLNDDWKASGSLVGWYTHFIDNPRGTKDFTLRKIASLTRKLDDSASLRFSAIHDDRYSNVSSRTADGWTLGASLIITEELLGKTK